MNQLIEFLSRPENHGTRNLLKWLQAFLGVSTGAGAATGSWQSLVTGLLFVFVKWLEAEASKVANESRIAQGEPEIEDVHETDFANIKEEHDKPDFSQIWSKSEAPTEKLPVQIERKEMFEQLGIKPMPAIPATFPDKEEIEKTEVILAGDKLHEVEFWNDDGERKVKSFTDKFEAIKFRNAKKYAKLLS